MRVLPAKPTPIAFRKRIARPALVTTVIAVTLAVAAAANAARSGWPWLTPYITAHARTADSRHLVGAGLSGGRVVVVNGEPAVRGVQVWVVTRFSRRTRSTQSAATRLCYFAAKAIAAHHYTARIGRIAVISKATNANGLHLVLAETERYGVCAASTAMAAVDL